MRIKRGIVAALALAAVAVAARARGRLRRTEVAGHSMEPALVPGDYLVTIEHTGMPRRGDIVVVPHPARAGLDLLKRVIGLPGESLTITSGLVHLDGEALAEPWANGPGAADGTWRIGPGEVFLLGDNREHSSSDGRAFGPLPLPPQWWLVRWRYWPPRRIGRV